MIWGNNSFSVLLFMSQFTQKKNMENGFTQVDS